MSQNSSFHFALCFSVLTAASCTTTLTSAPSPQDAEQALRARALAIHDRVLTLDTHADTPLRMIEPGFDMGVRHDPEETGSKVDYPRMKDGGLDAIFFAAFVAQGIRDDDGHTRARELGLQMIDAVLKSTRTHSDLAGLALTPEDAYELQKQGKRAIYLGV
ncbi:MAG: membrane dipeptidase, partial [Myxococcota bacterium]